MSDNGRGDIQVNNIENEVYTKIATAIRTQYGESAIFVTGEYTPTPPFFPCVYIHEADNFNAGYDGSNNEVVTAVMYEVEVYTNKQDGKKAQAKGIMLVADSVLTDLGFTRTMLQPLPNMSDATIYRLLARYTAAVIDNTIYRR